MRSKGDRKILQGLLLWIVMMVSVRDGAQNTSHACMTHMPLQLPRRKTFLVRFRLTRISLYGTAYDTV